MELLLSNHNKDCQQCDKNGQCELLHVASVTGARVSDILELAGVMDEANAISFISSDGYKSTVPLQYALKNDAIILYDCAYEAFITDDCPRSIFAIEGARQCAIEFCSLSKTAGFTGTRCGYTVIPKELERDGHNIYKLWYRREATKFNGVSYPVQCAAAAVFSEEGQKQIKENLSYYKENAKIISSALDELGIYYTGGKNSPYIWLECPNGMGSWEFFDYLLENANVVGTPGEGFGEWG